MRWSAPQRPVNYAEETLLTAILEGAFPPGATFPGERELAIRLGITRPTLREALRRLERDGWLTIQQGKPTRVNDFWREGGLNVLSAIVRFSKKLPSDFIENLLEIRLVIAPAYGRQAVERSPDEVIDFLRAGSDLGERPEAFASFDWRLHRLLAVACGNPIYSMILNGFSGFYEQMALRYFERAVARASSRKFYASLLAAAERRDPEEAGRAVKRAMRESIGLWDGPKR